MKEAVWLECHDQEGSGKMRGHRGVGIQVIKNFTPSQMGKLSNGLSTGQFKQLKDNK